MRASACAGSSTCRYDLRHGWVSFLAPKNGGTTAGGDASRNGWMGRHKAKKTPNKTAKPVRLNGFDFGVRRVAMLVGGFDFIEQFIKADITGIGYGIQYWPGIGSDLPIISLSACHAEPLRLGFDAIRKWDPVEGDDGLVISFVFTNDGGYAVGLTPDLEITRNRLFGPDRFFDPLEMAPIWTKQFSVRSKYCEDFRSYMEQPISPYLFGACIAPNEKVTPVPVEGAAPILKFSAMFWDEANVQPNTLEYLMLRIRQGTNFKRPRRPSRPPRPTAKDLLHRRTEQLRRHFPVTTWRLVQEGDHGNFRIRNPNLHIVEWQYAQAVCNLVLSNELINRPFYEGIPGDDLPNVIGQALAQRNEYATSTRRSEFDDPLILRQVELDGKHLLNDLECRPAPKSLDRVIGELKCRKLMGVE